MSLTVHLALVLHVFIAVAVMDSWYRPIAVFLNWRLRNVHYDINGWGCARTRSFNAKSRVTCIVATQQRKNRTTLVLRKT